MYNHQLDTFIKVADCGSFTKAAHQLYITPTAVLMQINLLEEMCGFKLFDRTNHGVALTPAGKSLYDDTLALIRFSNSALEKAKLFARASETTVRIATGVLYKCRLLPELCAKAGEINPDLRFEIPPVGNVFAGSDISFQFGRTHDIAEGIFCSILWKDVYNFFELFKTPLCLAVPKKHHLSNKKDLTMRDLSGEKLLMPVEGASYEIDAFREEINKRYPEVEIIDSPGYGLETFTLVEMNGYVLLTQAVYADVHTNLVTIPLETEYAMPYGLIYSLNPSPATKKFIAIVAEMKRTGKI